MLSVYPRHPVATGEAQTPLLLSGSCGHQSRQAFSDSLPCLSSATAPSDCHHFQFPSLLSFSCDSPSPHELLSLIWAFSIEEALCLLSVCLDVHWELSRDRQEYRLCVCFNHKLKLTRAYPPSALFWPDYCQHSLLSTSFQLNGAELVVVPQTVENARPHATPVYLPSSPGPIQKFLPAELNQGDTDFFLWTMYYSNMPLEYKRSYCSVLGPAGWFSHRYIGRAPGTLSMCWHLS